MRFTKDDMNGPVLVVAVTAGGPAARAGIVPRLLIHAIDGVETAGLGQREVQLLKMKPLASRGVRDANSFLWLSKVTLLLLGPPNSQVKMVVEGTQRRIENSVNRVAVIGSKQDHKPDPPRSQQAQSRPEPKGCLLYTSPSPRDS